MWAGRRGPPPGGGGPDEPGAVGPGAGEPGQGGTGPGGPDGRAPDRGAAEPGPSDQGGPGREERLRILRMVESGKLSPAEAVKLLEALEEGLAPAAGPGAIGPGAMRGRPPGGMRGPRARWAAAAAAGAAAGGAPARWIRVRVLDLRTGRPRLNLNLPMRLVGVALGMAERFSSYGMGEELDLAAILDGIRSGVQGKLVDLEDEEEGVRLEILVE